MASKKFLTLLFLVAFQATASHGFNFGGLLGGDKSPVGSSGGSAIPVDSSHISAISQALRVPESTVLGAVSGGNLDLGKLTELTGVPASSLLNSLGGAAGTLGTVGSGLTGNPTGGLGGTGSGIFGGSGGSGSGSVVGIDESKIPDIASALKVPVETVQKALIAEGKLDLALLQALTGISANVLKSALGGIGAILSVGSGLGGQLAGLSGGSGVNGILGGIGGVLGGGFPGIAGISGVPTAFVPNVNDNQISDISKNLGVSEDLVKEVVNSAGNLDLAQLAEKTGKNTPEIANALKLISGGSDPSSLLNPLGGAARNIGTVGSGLSGNPTGGLGGIGSGIFGGNGGSGSGSVVGIDESKIPEISSLLKVPVETVQKALVAKGKLDLALLQAATGISANALKSALGGIGAILNRGSDLGGLIPGLSGISGVPTAFVPNVKDNQISEISKSLGVSEEVVKEAVNSAGNLDLSKLAEKTGKTAPEIANGLKSISGVSGLGQGALGILGSGVNTIGNALHGIAGGIGGLFGGSGTPGSVDGGSGISGTSGAVQRGILPSQISDISKNLGVSEDLVKEAVNSTGNLDLAKFAEKTGKSASEIVNAVRSISGGSGTGTGPSVVDINESKIPDIASALKVPVETVQKALIAKGKLDLALLQAATGISANALKSILGVLRPGANGIFVGIDGVLGGPEGGKSENGGLFRGLFGGKSTAEVENVGSASGSASGSGSSGNSGQLVAIPSGLGASAIADALNVPLSVVLDHTKNGALDVAALGGSTGKDPNAILGALSSVFSNAAGTGLAGFGSALGGNAASLHPVGRILYASRYFH